MADWIGGPDLEEVCGLAGVDGEFIGKLLQQILQSEREAAKELGKPVRRALLTNDSYHF